MQLFSEEFSNKLKNVTNPYGINNASEKIIPILKSVDLDGLLKKDFFDIQFK